MTAQVVAERRPVGFGRGRRSSNIAMIHAGRADFLVLPSHMSQTGPEETLDDWTLAALGGGATAAEKNGFNLVWRYLRKHENCEDLVRSVFPANADAAVLLAPWNEHLVMLEMLRELAIPCVIAFGRHRDPRVPWVACDNAGGVQCGVRHLAALGHRRIGFLGGPRAVLDFEERRQAFLDSVKALGLCAEAGLLAESPLRHELEDILPVAVRLLRSPEHPTAVVCATALMAAALIQAAWNVGLQVPEDVAVVGFDDTSVAMQISPQLTTVRQPVSHVAGTATYLAACAAVGQEPETASWQVVLPVQFVVRESCGAAAVGRHAPEEPENAAASSEQAESGAAASPARIRMRQLEALNNELLETLYVASHDLRAPLVTINGFADVLDRKFGDALGGRGKATLSRIRRSGETMAQLLEALLNLSRSHHRPLTLQPIPLARVVQSALRDLEGQISSRGAEVWVSPDLPEVIGDELALHQVFLNLVGNAIKYADAGSQPQVRIGYVERAEEHEFSVEDNGSGIPPGLHERVFQPFQRGPGTERTEGLGIGLSIVKGIVLRHGGRIWVESEPENGAVFRFTLPRRPVTAGDKDGTAAVRSHAGAGIVE